MQNNTKSNILNDALLACKHAFISVALFSFFVNLLMLTTPIYMLQIYDRVLVGHGYDTLIYLSIIAVIALLIMALLDIARNRVLIHTSNWLEMKLSPISLHMSPDEHLAGRQYGAQGLKDIARIRQFLCSSSIFAIFDSPWVPFYLFVIFSMHMALGIIATIGAIVLFTLALMNELITRTSLSEANQLAIQSQHHVDAALRNADTIQAMGMMPAIVDHWTSKNAKVLELQSLVSRRASSIHSFSKFFRLILQIAILGIGSYFVIQGEITAGIMIAASILMSRALAPVEQAIGTWKLFVNARDSYTRLKNHLAQHKPRTAGIELPTPTGRLSIENTFYVPAGTQKPILQNLSVQINSGEMLAVIGPSGAGKSTLARLIVGTLKPSAGCIRLDGADVFSWDRTHFGQFVGYLPQDVELFGGTIKQNIARMSDANDEEIITAAKLAGVHEMILRFPEGYQTMLHPNAIGLSGGQRQRIALARALFRNPPLIVLDEPNSNLDHEGEQALLNGLKEMHQKGSTIIVIAHRPTVIRNVDRILVLNDGKIQFVGPRDTILDQLKEIKYKSAHQDSEN